MKSVLIKNIGALLTGELKKPVRAADSIYIEDGVIQEIGAAIGRGSIGWWTSSRLPACGQNAAHRSND